MCQNKGQYQGTCNLSSCTSKLPATWYNWGSRAWYCKPCAIRLSHDPVNKVEAQSLLGHSLCTEGKRLYTVVQLPNTNLDKVYGKAERYLYDGREVFEHKHQADTWIKEYKDEVSKIVTTVVELGVYFVLCGLDNTYTKNGKLYLVNDAQVEPLK